MLDQIKGITVSLFNAVLRGSADHGGTLRLFITAKANGEKKPLLVVGNAHSQVEDGHCIAIWTTEERLSTEVIAGCAYTGNSLKEVVRSKCGAMVELWIDAYKKDGVNTISKYEANDPKPA